LKNAFSRVRKLREFEHERRFEPDDEGLAHALHSVLPGTSGHAGAAALRSGRRGVSSPMRTCSATKLAALSRWRGLCVTIASMSGSHYLSAGTRHVVPHPEGTRS